MTKIAIAGGNDNYLLEAALELTGETLDRLSIFKEKYGVTVLMEETCEEELIELAPEIPTDTHMVVVSDYLSGETKIDAVRAYNKSDIFDAYFDAGYDVEKIMAGYGRIKPNLFNDSAKDS